LCLFSKPHEIDDFKEKLDEDADGHRCREEKKIDTDDEKIEDTMAGPIVEEVPLTTK